MDAATALLSTGSHFSMASKDLPQHAYHTQHGAPPTATRKRKPVVTYQSPGSGVVDVGLLVRNTALEIEAAAAAAAIARAMPTPSHATTVALRASAASASGTLPSAIHAVDNTTPGSATTPKVEATSPATRMASIYRPITIPRPPRPLYHPLSRPSTSKTNTKASATTSTSASQLAPPAAETGRRSSSRTRRPAPKMRDSEILASAVKAVAEKPSPAKRRRGPAAGTKRKRGAAQLDADGDGTYPAAKRTRKPRERVEVDVENETMPPPTTNGTSPPSGYSTRAKRPRRAPPVRAESSTSEGTGSATRTTPVNGPVEEFWVPTKST